MTSKLYSKRALSHLADRLRRRRKRIVFTNGCFDILHAGHVQYLEKAKQFGDLLIVGLNSDRSTKKLKGSGRPINPERDRVQVLSALTCVDYITIFDEDTPLELIKVIKPHVLVKGADWPFHSIAGRNEMLKWGGQVRRIRLLRGRSTTGILKKAKSKTC